MASLGGSRSSRNFDPEVPPAVILAAGEGRRFQTEEGSPPKPLVPLLGLPLIERAILSCKEAGVSRLFVVVGHRKEELTARLRKMARRHGLSLRIVENPDWKAGNGTSVLACKGHLSEPFFLVMADHLFDPAILRALREADDGSSPCLAAVDRRLDGLFDPADATLVRLEADEIRAIGKGLSPANAADTGLFLCRPEIFQALEEARQAGQGSLTAGIQRLLKKGSRVRALDIGGRFWLDVDDPEALAAGEEALMEQLWRAKRIDGPVSRHLNRRLSLRITRKIASYPVSPNLISLVSFAVGLLGAGAFFAVGLLGLGRPLVAWFFNALGGFLIQASSVLDGVDGEIARLKHQSSPYGAYFEYMLDRYVDGLAVSGMIYSAYVLSGNFTIILVGFLALIGLPLSSIHRAKFLAEAGRPYLAEYDGLLRFLPYSRDVRLLVIALGGVLNRVELALYFLAIVPNLVTLLRFYTVRRALER